MDEGYRAYGSGARLLSLLLSSGVSISYIAAVARHVKPFTAAQCCATWVRTRSGQSSLVDDCLEWEEKARDGWMSGMPNVPVPGAKLSGFRTRTPVLSFRQGGPLAQLAEQLTLNQ
jgi:hypothetical protein